jgi:hypothetical protein
MSAADRILCPTCQGGGETVDPRDAHVHPGNPDRRMVTCPGCWGDEYVTVAEFRKLAARAGWSQAEVRDWLAQHGAAA